MSSLTHLQNYFYFSCTRLAGAYSKPHRDACPFPTELEIKTGQQRKHVILHLGDVRCLTGGQPQQLKWLVEVAGHPDPACWIDPISYPCSRQCLPLCLDCPCLQFKAAFRSQEVVWAGERYIQWLEE